MAEGFDFNKLAQQMGLGSGGAPDKDAKPESLSDFINQLFDKTGAFISKFTGVNVNSLFNTGLQKNIDIQAAGVKVDNMMMPKNLDSQGGLVANTLGEVFKPSGRDPLNMGNASSGEGGGGSGGGGGGGDYASGGGGSGMNHFEGGHGGNFDGMGITAMPSGVAYGGSVSESMLGSMAPQSTPGSGASTGTGMDV